jgi:hypothetical protein
VKGDALPQLCRQRLQRHATSEVEGVKGSALPQLRRQGP